MPSLATLIWSLLGPALAGTGAVIALVAGVTGLWPLFAAAALGTLAAAPLSQGIARLVQAA